MVSNGERPLNPQQDLESAVISLYRRTGLQPPVAINVSDSCVFEVEALGSRVDSECISLLNRLKSVMMEREPAREKGEGLNELKHEARMLRRQVEAACGAPLRVVSVYGTYDCSRGVVTLNAGCLGLEECRYEEYLVLRILETLAHELVHHAQFTRQRKIPTPTGHRSVSVSLDCNGNLHKTLHDNVPYRYRPYEVEAFELSPGLAKELREDRTLLDAVLEIVKKYAAWP